MAGSDEQTTNQTQNQTGSSTGTTATNQTQNQNQNQVQATTSTVAPWEEAKPLLTSLLSKYSGLDVGLTDAQKSALTNLNASASGIPSFGADASTAVGKLFGSDTTPQVGMLGEALRNYQGALGKTASGAELDPYSTPGFSGALEKMTGDITNKVKGVYSAAGRDPSGAGSFAGSLGRGLTEGLSPLLQSQFNQNKANQMKAAGDLFSGTGTTAGQITSQEQIPLANAAQAVGLLPQVTSAYTAPAAAQVEAANLEQGQEAKNLSQLLTPAVTLAGLGQTTSGTGTTAGTGTTTTAGNTSTAGTTQASGTGKSTTSTEQSLLSNILSGATGVAGIASLLSDVDAKENIQPVGILNDGQKLYRFKYKGDPKTRVGLLAQQVEQFEPEAVEEVGGLKRVDYGRATDRAAAMERAA